MILRQYLRLRRSGEEGFGLVLVIGTTAVIMLLIVVIGGVATGSLTSSRQHVNFEASLAAAEQGLDEGLSRVSKEYDLDGSQYMVPSLGTSIEASPPCSGAAVDATGMTFATAAAEQSWATGQIALLQTRSACRTHTAQGDFVMFIPKGRQTVYSRGWSPGYGAKDAKTRLLKSEFIFGPYQPTNAVLTGGSLELDSSTTITTISSQAATLATIHSNGTVTTAGNPTVTGQVSSSSVSSASSTKFSANTGGAVVQTALQPIPYISAEQIYARQWSTYSMQWWDLCGDGKVRTPTSSTPCTGTVVGDYSTTGANNGQTFNNLWTFAAGSGTTPAVWTQGGGGNTVGISGVYFVDGANVASGNGNASATSMTVIAAATTTACSPKTGGDLNWNKTNISAPVIPNLFMLADHDLTTGANFGAGDASHTGMFIAGDQINMQTSSSGAYGSVIAADQCKADLGELDVIKNPSITYDSTGQAPFTSIINSTLWLEYVG